MLGKSFLLTLCPKEFKLSPHRVFINYDDADVVMVTATQQHKIHLDPPEPDLCKGMELRQWYTAKSKNGTVV